MYEVQISILIKEILCSTLDLLRILLELMCTNKNSYFYPYNYKLFIQITIYNKIDEVENLRVV